MAQGGYGLVCCAASRDKWSLMWFPSSVSCLWMSLHFRATAFHDNCDSVQPDCALCRVSLQPPAEERCATRRRPEETRKWNEWEGGVGAVPKGEVHIPNERGFMSQPASEVNWLIKWHFSEWRCLFSLNLFLSLMGIFFSNYKCATCSLLKQQKKS